MNDSTRQRGAVALTLVLTLLGCADDPGATQTRSSPEETVAAPRAETTTTAPMVGTTPMASEAGSDTAASDPVDPAAPATAAPATAPATAPPPTTPSTPAAPAPPAARLGGVALALEPFAEVPLPTAMAARPGDTAFYVTSQTGEVWRLEETDGERVLALDLTGDVSPYEPGSERGVLGIAFDPTDGRMFVYYTDEAIDSYVDSFALDAAGIADPESRLEVLFEEQPGLGHKGGGMAFDDAGALYVSFGDGGGSNGRDAQDYGKVLGAVIRIIPRRDGAPGYDVPADNPFVDDAAKRPEIWAKGLRNPWGFSIDPATGDLWTGDVGNNSMEEIDRIPAGTGGLNFGWFYIEGTQVNHRGAPDDVVAPVFAYRHDEFGPAVIGGRVYPVTAIPDLVGAYVFADMSGVFLAIGAGDETVRLQLRATPIITGFGTDSSGELYVLGRGYGVHRLVPG